VKEYEWHIEKTIDYEEDEHGITHVQVPWSGENVMQTVNV